MLRVLKRLLRVARQRKAPIRKSSVTAMLALAGRKVAISGWLSIWKSRFLTFARPPPDPEIVVGFEHEADAQRFRDAMRARLEEFALTLHPDKTRLIAFGRFAADRRAQRGSANRRRSAPGVHPHLRAVRPLQLQRKKPRRPRMRATLRRVKDALRRRMHQPIPFAGRWLTQVVSTSFAGMRCQ